MKHDLPPGRPVRQRTTALALAAAILLPATVGACSKDDKADDVPAATLPKTTTTAKSATTTTAPTTTTEPKSDEEQAAQVVIESNRLYFELLASPTQSTDPMKQFRTGEAFDLVEGAVRETKVAGEHTTFRDNAVPEVTPISANREGDTIVVRGCLVDDSISVFSDGSVANDSISSRLVDYSLKQDNQKWLIFDVEEVERWRDGNGCDR